MHSLIPVFKEDNSLPVTCFTKDKERLVSFEYSSEEWDNLKSSYKSLGLYMRCCDAPAIPKTSQLGTQFFAHKSDACGEGVESAEHILCKELVVKGAKRADWHASPEEPGIDKESNTWVADVLCSNGDQNIVFEVQLASQTFAEYKRRNLRYEKSGVRCIWLIERKRKHPIAEQMILDRINSKNRKDAINHYPDREDMPVFQVDMSERENIFVFFPWHHGRGPYQIPLEEFAFGVLSEKMAFKDGRWCWNV